MQASDFLGGGVKPKLITRITSGTGTYIPTVDLARCLVRIQGAGAGGHTSLYAGGGGAMVEVVTRIPIAGLPYVVGAAGAVSTNGSQSSFGQFVAPGGSFGNTSSGGVGGAVGLITGPVDADGVTMIPSGLGGVSGGFGGYSSGAGGPPGFPIDPSTGAAFSAPVASQMGVVPRNGQGNGSGGNSFFGIGGTTGNSPAAGNYGAGGGINAAGLGGCIEIWDMGA